MAGLDIHRLINRLHNRQRDSRIQRSCLPSRCAFRNLAYLSTNGLHVAL